jgi:AcrR family transcriptional regulator
MSLYRHVPSKDDLVLFMIDAAFGEASLPEAPPQGWRARLALSTRLQWKTARRHPWLAQALSIMRPQIAPNGLRHTEWALSALDGLGLAPSDMLHIHLLLISYVRGLAMNLESEAQAEHDTGMTSDEWMRTQQPELAALAGTDTFRTFLRIAQNTDFDLNLDTLFEFGLTRLLDGLAVYLDPPIDPGQSS